MTNLLFELVDGNGVRWAGKRLGDDIWLIRWIDNSGQWITVRTLTEQELEECQKMAGCYPRA
jgi:hypothetical protein